ncbi:MAG TPA: hypothetical protein PLA11_05050 [Flavobacteriales bacterium]|nr:hypothetical protein [Flavobacteriales bacterium]MCB0782821.1 hypothetical protein [Flavobacteriales bacterium]MCB0787832.1 hypothetical protein [Flavobacteriales bacterium]MCB0812431.1 hypothetical protein [Flavobacteriales bacterium]MCB0817599.1 hypothetical protein [Flavobacteriales bacterium]
MRVFRYLLIAVGLAGVPVMVSAQEGMTMKQQEKVQAKKEKERKKAQKQVEKEKRKRHLELQDKATRKRIKRHNKRADKGGSDRHRDPFLQRLFGTRH